ncbi:hypothetical protein B9Z65_4629 [Elsinoe australis]|uniref:Uncharacterized protein n=1 Tax=Elsinoe australis TaxID=40998 RepID=A0A2P8A5L3_9PEZI|nr:hypothetical protein B9Z65_4629 [Elsinoe australis]
MARKATESPAPASGIAAAASGGATGTRRSTRSQSREPQATTQLPTRTTRGGSRQPDPEEQKQVAAEGLSGLARGALHYEHELQPVVEEADGQPSQTSYAPLVDEHDQRVSQNGRNFSLGATSTYSTFSQEEVANIDSDAIVASLPDLDGLADGILKTAVPPTAAAGDLQQNVRKLNNERDPFRKTLLGRVRTFARMQSDFGRQTFINPEHILRALLHLEPHVELLNTPWRPDDVLYKANLVAFLQVVFESKDPARILEAVSTLDSHFPSMLLSSLLQDDGSTLLVGESQLLEATRNLAIEIRTQVFIFAIAQRSYVEPLDRTLARVFLFEPEGEDIAFPSDLGVEHIRNWDHLDGIDQHEFYTRVRDHVTALKGFLDSCHEDVDHALSQLQPEHSWERFCLEVLSWVQKRHQELCDLIEGRGGAPAIADHLRQEVERTQDGSDDVLDPAIGGTGGPRSSLASRSNIQALKRRLQQPIAPTNNEHDMEPHHLEQLQQAVQDHATDGPVFEMDDEQPIESGRQKAGQVNEALLDRIQSRSSGIGNQENRRLIDRQPHGHRVEFDTQQSMLSPSGQASSLPGPYHSSTQPSSNRRRTRVDADISDPSEDEGLQTDPRVHRAPQRAPRANMTTSGGLDRNVRPRTSNMHDISDHSPARPQVPRRNPGQAMDPLDTQPYGEDGSERTGAALYTQANALARASTNHRSPRARTPWSDAEVEALIDLIATYGISWALIKQEDQNRGNVLQKRTPEDLRFKARNMKVDYLKARVALPDGFERVPLGKKEIDKLPPDVAYTQDTLRNHRSRQEL